MRRQVTVIRPSDCNMANRNTRTLLPLYLYRPSDWSVMFWLWPPLLTVSHLLEKQRKQTRQVLEQTAPGCFLPQKMKGSFFLCHLEKALFTLRLSFKANKCLLLFSTGFWDFALIWAVQNTTVQILVTYGDKTWITSAGRWGEKRS